MSRRKLLGIFKYLVISLLALMIIIPFWDMVINSFKTAQESAIPTIGLPSKWQVLENYRTVIIKGKLINAFKNSVIITAFSTVLVLTISSMAAYVFGRRKEKRIRMVFFIFMMGIITPPSMIVSTLMMRYMGLLGTYHGMILFYAATFCPLPIFILTSFMATIPRDLEEAAIIDGASSFGIFSMVTLPLLRPAIATTFIWVVLKIWNDFLFPIYILAGETKKYTMILSLYYFRGQFYTAWNLVFADLILISIPVIIAFIFAQRQIVQGLTAGALKG
jgi:raffinose/stachyose/melibiose transport system permease protein